MLSEQTKQTLKDWQALLLERRHRGLVHIQGDRQWAFGQAQVLSEFFSCDRVFVPELEQALDYNRLKKRLGSETSLVVFDSFSGFHSNAFALIAGTLVSGGILILISPKKETWPSFNDPDLKRFTSFENSDIHSSYFLERLQLMLSEFPAVILEQGFADYVFPKLDDHKVAIKSETAPFAEQRLVVEMIKKVAAGHAKRPVLLTADRGRGKSAALGIAARELLQQRDYKIVITANAKSSLDSFYAHLGVEYREVVSFYPVDEIVKKQPEADLLIIDEAAAIPAAILTEFISFYNRLVFASTVHGYEGNGQGLMLRFAKTLSERMPGWKKAVLHQPIRYAFDDPLERLVNNLFVLDGQGDDSSKFGNDEIQYEYIEQKKLAQDEPLLRQVFTLLISAHYQTSADDLRTLLDMQGLKIFIARSNARVIGVLLIVLEGEFTQSTQQALLESSRRFRGHILPQQCSSSGFSEALALRFARVMRIAVSPECRRLHIGRKLLHTAEKQLAVDCFGASFALEADVLRFWQQSDFVAVALGSKKESSSGAYSTVVLKAISTQGKQLTRSAHIQFNQLLPYQLLTNNSDLAAEVAGLLCYRMGNHVDQLQFRQAMIDCYCQSQIGLEQVQPFLAQKLLSILAKDYYLGSMAGNICIALLLQGRSFSEIAKSYDLTGRKAVEVVIRQYFMTTGK